MTGLYRTLRVRLLVLIAAPTLLFGCTFSNGEFPKANVTNVQLSTGNFRITQTQVRGSDSGFQFLGIGTRAKYGDAMDELRLSSGVAQGPNRALINVTEDHSTTYWLGILLTTDNVTITADVVEFDK